MKKKKTKGIKLNAERFMKQLMQDSLIYGGVLIEHSTEDGTIRYDVPATCLGEARIVKVSLNEFARHVNGEKNELSSM